MRRWDVSWGRPIVHCRHRLALRQPIYQPARSETFPCELLFKEEQNHVLQCQEVWISVQYAQQTRDLWIETQNVGPAEI